MHHANLIEEQIESCSKLLQLFRDERVTFGESETVDLNLVMKMLKRKQDILASFETQKKLMSSIRESGYQNEDLEKKLLKELSRLFEQLLVIDQENEILLREVLTKKPGKAKAKPQSSPMRPGLPFCPSNKAKVNDSADLSNKEDSTMVNVSQSTAALSKLNHFSRNRLKAYGA